MIIKRNKSYIENHDNIATVSIYRMAMPIDYNKIITRFNNIYKKYSKKYLKTEKTARENREGIWQGEFDMPWDWRRKYK